MRFRNDCYREMEQESEGMILFCPDLTGKEEIKAMLIGNGDFVRPVLHPCIKEKCVAYKDGKCMKYDNEVERESERTNI